MRYDCIAATKGGARCGNFVEVEVSPKGVGYFEKEEELMCSLHRSQKEKGKEVKLASRPDIILIKFKLNPNWFKKLANAGIPVVPDRATEKDALHAGHARQYRRDPYRFRKTVADSGVPIFGPEGLKDVSVAGLWPELLMQRYRVVNTHIIDSKERMKVWVNTLALEDGEQKPVNLPDEVYQFLGSCFEHCHLWANPPNGAGKIVHTLNVSHRQAETETKWEIRFNKGLWAAVPFQKEV